MVRLWGKYPDHNCYKEGEEGVAYCPQGLQSIRMSCHLAGSKQRTRGACWCWSEEFVATGCDTRISGFKKYYPYLRSKKRKICHQTQRSHLCVGGPAVVYSSVSVWGKCYRPALTYGSCGTQRWLLSGGIQVLGGPNRLLGRGRRRRRREFAFR